MLLFDDAWPKSAPPRSVIRNATEIVRNAIFFIVIFISPQPLLRIFGAIVLPDLEIEIGRRRLFALCRSCNRLARRDAGSGGCFYFDSVVGREGVELRVSLPAEALDDLAVGRPRQSALNRADVERPGARSLLLRKDFDQPLEPFGLLLQLGEVALRAVLLALERCDESFLLGVRRGDGVL